MRYSTNNIKVSLTMALAAHLRAGGYDIYWQATNEVDAQTAGLGSPRAVVTLVPDFPANPGLIVRLKSEDAGAEEIAVPAFSLRTPTLPRRTEILGLGHSEWVWTRRVFIDGFALDEFQHMELVEVFHSWIASVPYKELTIFDYDTNPVSPPELGKARVGAQTVEHRDTFSETEAVRYYIRLVADINYEE